MLAAGIDVFSTVNVQHLESLNDQVAELTGVRVRETLPDAVLGEADEVVLVDLTPEALIARLRAGKVYPGERVQAALDGFFKIENLAALREVALRQVAEEVEAKRLRARRHRSRATTRLFESAAPQAIGERLLALVEPAAQSPARRAPRLALGPAARRRARHPLGRAAQRADRGASASSSTRCGGWPPCSARTCSSSDGDDVAARAPGRRRARHDLRADRHARAAQRAAAPARAGRCRSGCSRLLPGVDVRIVADRSRRATEHGR